MQISEFPRPSRDTGLGIHASANVSFPLGEFKSGWDKWIDEFEQMGISWVKLLTGPGDNPSALEVAAKLLANDMMPIIRPYRAEPAPYSLFDEQPEFKPALQKFIDIGCKYIETHLNEPNLLAEWRGGWGPDSDPGTWRKGAQPDRVAEAWVKDAQVIIQMGGYPGTPPCAPGGDYNDIDFFKTFCLWLKIHGYTELMKQGVWISMHNATLNHPLDYPYDKVNQEGTKLTQDEYGQHKWHGSLDYVNGERTRGRNAGQHLLSVNAEGKDVGASNCWKKYEALEKIWFDIFGFQVPVLSTEGGTWEDGENSPDPRYWIHSVWDVVDKTINFSQAMMRGDYPSYYFCTCPWLVANKGMGNPANSLDGFEKQAWYSPFRENGQQPVVQAMKDMPKQVRPAGAPVVIEPPAELPVILTPLQIASILYSEGFTGEGLVNGIAIVLAESNGNTKALGDTSLPDYPGHSSRGMWQIFSYSHGEVSDECAFDPFCSTKEAFRISRGGTYYGEWSTFSGGAYLSRLGEARAAIAELGIDAQPDEETLINAAWNSLGIAYNPTFAFPVYAGRKGYGVPAGNEFEFKVGQTTFVCQLFKPSEYILLWCKKGDTDHIMETVVG